MAQASAGLYGALTAVAVDVCPLAASPYRPRLWGRLGANAKLMLASPTNW